MRRGIYLYWIPLGAGGSGFVRMNGRVYEAVKARTERRRPLALFHTALEVRTSRSRYVIETMWPSPDADTAARGVVLVAPVGHRRLARLRTFRYEVRCWSNGELPDADEAVGGARHLSADDATARRLMVAVADVPGLVWGRDERGAGEMWNSNSVISWLLVRSGVPMTAVRVPEGGRAPGWHAGIAVAEGSLGPARKAVVLCRGRRPRSWLET